MLEVKEKFLEVKSFRIKKKSGVKKSKSKLIKISEVRKSLEVKNFRCENIQKKKSEVQNSKKR